MMIEKLLIIEKCAMQSEFGFCSFISSLVQIRYLSGTPRSPSDPKELTAGNL